MTLRWEPTFNECGGLVASRGHPAHSPVPAEACAIGIESQNFQTKRGAAWPSVPPVAANFA
jgi:hypothetical protein